MARRGASVENEKTTLRAVTSLVTAHLMGPATVCCKFRLTTNEGSMKRLLVNGFVTLIGFEGALSQAPLIGRLSFALPR